MIKELDVQTKIEFQEFLKMMAVRHFQDTRFRDIYLLDKDVGIRIMDRYTKLPSKSVEDFEVFISAEKLDTNDISGSIPEEIDLDNGDFYHLHIEIKEELKVVDYFELIEYVNSDLLNMSGLYKLYINSSKPEKEDFDD